jgi:hypothetical protein
MRSFSEVISPSAHLTSIIVSVGSATREGCFVFTRVGGVILHFPFRIGG